MADSTPLDLATIDPPIWRIMVNDAVYGPYTYGQMQSFQAENRLTDTSLVAEGNGGAFLPAMKHTGLQALFEVETPPEETKVLESSDPENFVIILQGNSECRSRVIEFLNPHGYFAELMPGTFILHSGTSLFALRTGLADILDEDSRIILTNASTGQLAWAGLHPDADQHVKAVWKAKPTD